MEKTLTAAGRIRRQFAAGRPPKPGTWDTRTALRTIVQRLDSLVSAMETAGLNREDLTAIAVIGELAHGPDPLATDHITTVISHLPLTIKGESHLTATLEAVMPYPQKVIIGTVFQIADRDERAKAPYVQWASPAFRDIDGEAERVLADVLKRVTERNEIN